MLFRTLLALSTLIAGQALAKSRGQVINCSGEKVKLCVFNGKDSSRVYPKEVYILKDGEYANISCKGQGKRRCKVNFIDPRDSNDDCGYLFTDIYKVNKEEILALTKYKRHDNTNAEKISSVTCNGLD